MEENANPKPLRLPPRTLGKNRNRNNTKLLLDPDDWYNSTDSSKNSFVKSSSTSAKGSNDGRSGSMLRNYTNQTNFHHKPVEASAERNNFKPVSRRDVDNGIRKLQISDNVDNNTRPKGTEGTQRSVLRFSDGTGGNKPQPTSLIRSKTQVDLKNNCQTVFVPAGCNWDKLIKKPIDKTAENNKKPQKSQFHVTDRQRPIQRDEDAESWDVPTAAASTSAVKAPNREGDAVPKKKSMKAKLEENRRHKLSLSSSSSTSSKPFSDIAKDAHTPCTCQDYSKCKFWIRRNVEFPKGTCRKKGWPLLRSNDNPGKIPQIQQEYVDNLVFHGSEVVKPHNSLLQLGFNGQVQKALLNFGIKEPLKMQSYIWRSIQRRMNIFMVSASKTGKTLAYLPSMCTFALEKQEYSELSIYEGPLIMILCHTNKCCENIYKLFDDLLAKFEAEKPNVELVTKSENKINCDILITTANVLDDLLKTEKLSLKRLCHLILEETHVMLKEDTPIISNLFRTLHDLQSNRPHNKSIQLVVNCKKWSVNMEKLFSKIYITPLICFDNCWNAALYSKVNFEWKKVDVQFRQYRVLDILAKHYKSHNTVLFCDDRELSELSEHLTLKGIENIVISSDMIEGQIKENEDMWCSLKEGKFKVLLVTDAVFDETSQIKNAQWLIHYSPPSSKTQLLNRFQSLSKNLHSPLDPSKKMDLLCYFMRTGDEITEKLYNRFMEHFISNLSL